MNPFEEEEKEFFRREIKSALWKGILIGIVVTVATIMLLGAIYSVGL